MDENTKAGIGNVTAEITAGTTGEAPSVEVSTSDNGDGTKDIHFNFKGLGQYKTEVVKSLPVSPSENTIYFVAN